MVSEIGKYNILEVDKEFVTLTFKCYLCKHWTVVRIPKKEFMEKLKEEEG